jgi:alpha-galactosidase
MHTAPRARLKVAVLGAGSFVFGPSVLHQAIDECRMDRLELALVDVATDVLEPLAAVGRRMAERAGVDVILTTHSAPDTALDGADFVVSAVAVDMRRRFSTDPSIVLRHDPNALISEFGGVTGLCYSLRQIAFFERLAFLMQRLCPTAPLLTVSNPLPRVCQAAQAMGLTTWGFCSVSLCAYDMVSRLLDGVPSRYPFEAPRRKYDLTIAGTNHLAWVIAARERATARDLLPDLVIAARAGRTSGHPRIDSLLLETGHLISSGDEHCMDFLPPSPLVHSIAESSHGSAEDRAARLTQLRRMADGLEPPDPLFAKESWEKPLEVIHARAGGPTRPIHAINLPNAGQISNLPRGVYVETAAQATTQGPIPTPPTSPAPPAPPATSASPVTLPNAVLPYSLHTAQVTDTIVRAALFHSRRLAHEVVDLDASITNKPAAHSALDDCLTAHADMLPGYA